MKQTKNAVTELAGEHDVIDRLAVRIANLGPGSERTGLVHEVSARFLIHAQAEERYLHPAVCRILQDGTDVAQLQAHRNRAVARTIETVERGEAQGDEMDALVTHLLVGVQDHVDRQNTVLLPELIEVGSAEEIELLGIQLHDGIRTARTAAERAGARARERAQDKEAEAAAAGSEPAARGFRALLQRIARTESG